MTIDRSDPRLTAYALGELRADRDLSASELKAFEAELGRDPEAQRELSLIRATATWLEEELAQGVPTALGSEKRAEIAAASAGARAPGRNALGSDVVVRPLGSAHEPPASPCTPPRRQDATDSCTLPNQQGSTAPGGDSRPELKVVPLTKRPKFYSWLAAVAMLVSGGLAVLAVSFTARPDREMAPIVGATETQADGRESGSGTRALGEEGAIGRARRSVQGPQPYAMPEGAVAPLEALPSPQEPLPQPLAGLKRRYSVPRPSPTIEPSVTPQRPAFENPFISVAQDPRSTFSIDVDTAGYSRVRSHLESGQRPPQEAVRIEELVNYFRYDYPYPTGDVPFAVSNEVAAAPWAREHKLVRIGIRGKQVAAATRPNANLVFLLDVSGSMASADKLPLLKRGLKLLTEQLDAGDRVTIVVYAGASGLVLPPTPGNQHDTIMSAMDRLDAGGSTNGGEGILLAYQQAARNFISGGVNRVILATDGDFNVGVTGTEQLVGMVEERARGGIFLSVLGFGREGNDAMLERIADRGNGNYAFIDNESEARKVLVEQAAGTLITIAKDVKIQVEFNPQRAEAFRLIGYENRKLEHQDFTDDRKDAGEIGSGHTVTALYEVVPRSGSAASTGNMLRYQQLGAPTEAAQSGELLIVRIRYKQPNGDMSHEEAFPLMDAERPFGNASSDFRFAAAVASFGMLLRNSRYAGDASYGQVLELAGSAVGGDPLRSGFVDLVRKAQPNEGWRR